MLAPSLFLLVVAIVALTFPGLVADTLAQCQMDDFGNCYGTCGHGTTCEVNIYEPYTCTCVPAALLRGNEVHPVCLQ